MGLGGADRPRAGGGRVPLRQHAGIRSPGSARRDWGGVAFHAAGVRARLAPVGSWPAPGPQYRHRLTAIAGAIIR